jgi:hypothetical protein
MTLQGLVDEMRELYRMAPQPRGYAFEKFLKKVFDVWGLDGHSSFRLIGEQIDGSFFHSGKTFLMEAKWHDALVGATTLHGFQGKVLDRIEGTMGLFVSYAGFSEDGLQSFSSKRVILMDGLDLDHILSRGLSLGKVIDAKLRHASERKKIFARVSDLFPL